jgi:hypothetical protein
MEDDWWRINTSWKDGRMEGWKCKIISSLWRGGINNFHYPLCHISYLLLNFLY